MKRLLVLLMSVVVAWSCAVPVVAQAGPTLQVAGDPWKGWFIRSLLTDDEELRLEDDFYTAANRKGILAYNAHPTDVSSVTEERMNEIADQVFDLLMAEDAGSSEIAHDLACLRTLYDLYADWDARDADGVKPVDDIIDRLCDIETLDEFTDWLCSDDFRLSLAWRESSEYNLTISQGLSLFRLMAYNDVDAEQKERDAGKKDGGEYVVEIYEPDYKLAAYGLDDSDVIVQGKVDRERLEEVKLACTDVEVAYEMLRYFGFDRRDADETAQDAATLEAGLADNGQEGDEDSSSALESEQSLTFDELGKKCKGGFPLDRILAAWGYDDAEEYLVEDTEWLDRLNGLYIEDNLDALVSHALASIALESTRLLDYEASCLCGEVDGSRYYSKTIAEALEEGCTDGSDEVDYSDASDEDWALWYQREACSYLREVAPTSFGKAYVETYYDASVGHEVERMVRDYLEVYEGMLGEEDWLSKETREAAIRKLRAMNVKVGHPKTWPDTDGVDLRSHDEGGTLFSETRRMAEYDLEQELYLLRHPDEGEYWHDCTDVNAYYDVATNSVSIGVGIMGGVYWPKDGTYEQKLAGLGTTIGHEITHAFDDQGAYFDEYGNFEQWWTDKDLAAFEKRVEGVVDCFDAIDPIGRGRYDGMTVCGEAIADMGGLKASMLVAAGEKGFDYDAFFRAYAHCWLSVTSVADVENHMATDTHPLNNHRVNVPLRELDEFYQTYSIKRNDGMWLDPKDRVSVW